jgi:hypothetical protein
VYLRGGVKAILQYTNTAIQRPQDSQLSSARQPALLINTLFEGLEADTRETDTSRSYSQNPQAELSDFISPMLAGVQSDFRLWSPT